MWQRLFNHVENRDATLEGVIVPTESVRSGLEYRIRPGRFPANGHKAGLLMVDALGLDPSLGC